MSLFRFAKYSTILFFLGKYRNRIFRVVAVLLFAAVTSLLYQDVADYLHRAHPGTVIYALIGKVVIVYGALAFVLLQFRPAGNAANGRDTAPAKASGETPVIKPAGDRLAELEDLQQHDRLRSRYDRLIEGGKAGNSDPQ